MELYVSVSLRSIIHSYLKDIKMIQKDNNLVVSVSLRSIIHSYPILLALDTIEYIVVSVSLRSIIHSYSRTTGKYRNIFCWFPSPYGVSFILMLFSSLCIYYHIFSFRLLTEYHSFLSFNSRRDVLKIVLSFRLLTEYHSFLC